MLSFSSFSHFTPGSSGSKNFAGMIFSFLWPSFLDIITVIIWETLVVHDLYEMMNVFRGFHRPGPDFAALVRRYFNSSLVILIFFNSTLWAVKFSFLIFFRRLGKNVRGQRQLFWSVFAFTFVSYMITLALVANLCVGKSLLYVLQKCGTRSAMRNNRITLIVSFVLDILTDFASKQYSLFFLIFHCRI